MNTLANDQTLRLQDYLRDAGFSGTVSVRQYSRSTGQTERQEIRKKPPYILLTNACARQGWQPEVPVAEQARRYPALVPVGTSTPIQSVSDAAQSRGETLRMRDTVVQEFFSKLTGFDRPLFVCLARRLRQYRLHWKRAILRCQ